MQKFVTWTAVIGLILILAIGIWYRAAPRIIATSEHPRGFSEIRIVETPTSFINGLFLRYNPTYRFEYRTQSRYLWSATSYSGESYNAQHARIEWISDTEVICYLDDMPIANLVGRYWIKPNQ